MIYYKKRRHYKYTLQEDYQHQTELKPKEAIDLGFVKLSKDGLLSIKSGYSWDGPSGPTIDTKNFMRGSLVHDALYQLLREECIEQDKRDYSDRLLQQICLECGMWKIRAWWVYWALRLFGASSAKPDMLQAP